MKAKLHNVKQQYLNEQDKLKNKTNSIHGSVRLHQIAGALEALEKLEK